MKRKGGSLKDKAFRGKTLASAFAVVYERRAHRQNLPVIVLRQQPATFFILPLL